MYSTIKNGVIYELTISTDLEGKSVQSILKEHWKLPKKMVHQWRMEKAAGVNGQPADWLAPLAAGDRLSLPLFRESEEAVFPSNLTVEWLYEDNHILVANKPAGMKTHPNASSETDTLLNAAAHRVYQSEKSSFIRHVHRLDEQTSGAVLFAKHEAAYAVFSRLLEERSIKRTYLAAVQGCLKKQKGILNQSIGRDRHHPTRRRVSPSGQKAITHYEVIKEDKEQGFSIVKCQLATGRTHQIRVHFSAIGHPLLGDRLYGGKPILSRQALHAAEISIPHPFIGETITCSADAPPDLLTFFR
ncbi:RluA family pseudouridine synthase [Bacillus thermotolerans]|mgnify:CR=1 FL=1|uniref:Pseudouridine synthase n=1 Tax=Bacillus thermotolerans TaxID=1221996 RepID=A0A0F5I4T0_BACTR|nr:RluA family pseudouridine synthase [Bacillus thermotolerans]KKB35657.1 ribosomal large subunit pseudouridine synthase D like protein [Bacillus thermotolerans]KKB40488.1 ribosomal large subunit pseudouridine synthase D like protein [Bacillus thermotolerans]KKB42885.1 ribosomal large subunit pseudouridine synthase D like protein [Bacillus thermotolerans]